MFVKKAEEREKLILFCEKISLPQAAIEKLLTLMISEEEFQLVKSIFDSQEGEKNQFYKYILAKEDSKIYFLFYYCRFAMLAYDKYKEYALKDQIYIDTFYDITLWCNKCFEEYGVYGIAQYDWLWRHVEVKLLRLGRLQFERMPSLWEVVYKGQKLQLGEEVISIHIPEGSPLDTAECRNSLEDAKKMFKDNDKFVCHSWLLFPRLTSILSETSNIIKFQNLFDIVLTDYETKEAESRIFGKIQEDPQNYQENTKLQFHAKKYLLLGKPLGSGMGFLK